ncbi:alpha/beta hydrolase [Microvirga sp. W0021]|uniref:Alpha/beta hydrolase n=1 Tax=Hohaiivirga grylli TaxID=3133970 RepID=A0ABV0BKI9_9HYPH
MTVSIPMKRQLVQTNGISTSILEAGRGRPTILLHGTSSSALMGWGPLLPELGKTRRCLAPDFIGSGETQDNGGAITLDMLIAQVKATAALAPDEPIDIIGYSLGAVVAAAVASEMPDRIRRLILIGGWVKSDIRMNLLFDSWITLARTNRSQLANFVMLNGLSDAFFETIDEITLANLQNQYAENLSPGSDRQAALDATIDICARLPDIKAETLVISMTDDRMVRPHHCRQLARGIKGARFEEIDAGHLVFVEKPERVVELIEALR